MQTEIETAKSVMKEYKGGSLEAAKAALAAVGKDPTIIERYMEAKRSEMYRNRESFMDGPGCPWFPILWREVERQIVGRERPTVEKAVKAVRGKFPGCKFHETEAFSDWTGRGLNAVVANGLIVWNREIYAWEYRAFEFGSTRLYSEYVGKRR